MIIASRHPRHTLSASTASLELERERELVRRRYGKSWLVSASHFGNIYRVFDPASGAELIVKMVSRVYKRAHVNIFTSGGNTLVCEDTELEAQVLEKSRLRPHPSVAAAAPRQYSLDAPTHYGLALRSYNGGDLYNYLRDHGRLRPQVAVGLVLRLLGGVRHLHHDLGFTHNDISLENVLLHFPDGGSGSRRTADATPVLIDFGLATPFGEAPQVHDFKPAYRAPELYSVLEPSQMATAPAGTVTVAGAAATAATAATAARGAGDVYSCGMVLLYLVAGLVRCYVEPTPADRHFRNFQGPRLQELIHRVSRSPSPGCVPSTVCDLIRIMTRANPAERASVDEATALARAVLAQLAAPTASAAPTAAAAAAAGSPAKARVCNGDGGGDCKLQQTMPPTSRAAAVAAPAAVVIPPARVAAQARPGPGKRRPPPVRPPPLPLAHVLGNDHHSVSARAAAQVAPRNKRTKVKSTAATARGISNPRRYRII